MPSTVAGLVFLIAALSPGLIYHRVVERYRQRDRRSTVAEVAELATVGSATSIVALVVVLAFGQETSALVAMRDLAGGWSVLRDRPWAVVLTVVAALSASIGLAALGGFLVSSRTATHSARIHQGSVWAGVLGKRRDGRAVFLAVELDDGRLIEGYFRSVSVAEDPARDAIVLRKPIAVSGPGDIPRAVADEDFVLIPRGIAKAVHGKYPVRTSTVPAANGDR